MVSTSNAHWTGGLKDGKGTLNTKSSTLRDTPYDFRNRFEGGTGTTPEEMIATAHGGGFGRG